MAQADGYITWYNRRWYDYTGKTPEDMEGWGWQSVHDPATLPAVLRRWRESIATGTAFEMEFPLRGADGKFRRFLTRVVPLMSGAGAVLHWFGTNTDVTELMEAQEALRESDRRKSEFLAMLSHELRNPLAPIRNSVYLLERAPPGSDQATRAKAVIRRQAEHLTRLVDDLLDVTRISRGKVELHRERLDLREVVRRACDDHDSIFESNEISLRLDVLARPLWIDADATRLSQVVSNLLQNAAKFTPARGAVSVTVETSDGQALLRIRDDGVGMEQRLIDHIFEPFVQADLGLARTKGGLGLGLALAKGLLELHGGTVSAHSEGLGHGSEFLVTLPLARPPRLKRPAPEGGTGSHSSLISSLILIIEDNLDAGQSLADILELQGHRTRVARDGRSGLELARELHPDVILCDIGLPDLNGYEVARALRSDDALRSTSLIALSGYAQPEDRQRASEAGFDAHIAKPAPLDELTKAIADHLKRRG